MGIKRVIRCNPLSKNIYDPVPKKEKKRWKRNYYFYY
jgi:putative component of membrane protein insertase Oxa1/YidC/SpoIIIJ protein YidD